MSQPGCEVVARWREAGEWWSAEPYREFVHYLDHKGILRERSRDLPSLGVINAGPEYHPPEDHREEWSLRISKLRDEKVAIACGLYTPAQFERRKQSGQFACLHVRSGYTFGNGVMLAEEIAPIAAAAGAGAVLLADRFSLVGAVEFSRMCKKIGVKPLIGATLEMPEGGELVLIAQSKKGFSNLSQLVSVSHLNQPRQFPLGTWEELERFSSDLICLSGGDGGPINRLIAQRKEATAANMVERLRHLFGSRLYFQIERCYLPWEIRVNRVLFELGERYAVTCVAGGEHSFARREHYITHDALVCTETLCLVDQVIGRKILRDNSQPQITQRPSRALNAEKFVKSYSEMLDLYAERLDLVANTMVVASRCDDDVLPSRTQLPKLFDNPAQALRDIVMAGAHLRHSVVDRKLKIRLNYELERICRLNFADHFLTIWDACRWADDQNILFSGRGSVVDCAVAYCMGISRIDAFRHRLHFDRFLPNDGSKRPDIDVDFEAKRRNDVRNYLTRKYGVNHVATVAAVGAYCSRGIIREVGKILGLPKEVIGFLAKRLHGGVSPVELEKAIDKRPELRGSNIPKERFRWVYALAERMMDIPRNIRSHSSGVVISSRPLAETVPVMYSGGESEGEFIRIIQWDKRSAKHYFDKFDILCLRGQDVLSGTQERIRIQDKDFRVAGIPLDDEDTYRAMRSGELIGIPQSASPAMRQAHIRLQTKDLHDASLVQAGIRPGVGGAVKINELIARRRGKPYSFDHAELDRILGITYGIIVFQEQVDQLLQTFGGYSSGEAEMIREAIHERRREDFGQTIRDEIVAKVCSNGYSHSVAEQVFDYVSNFKGYGFAQGHALAFAEISVRSIFCQQNYPAEYFASLLSAQPAGYYGPCTIANEARCRGVKILPACVNRSTNVFTVEDVKSTLDPTIVLPNAGIRVALSQVGGISQGLIARVMGTQPFTSYWDFVLRAQPERDECERMILCGALDSLHPNRREMLWMLPKAIRYRKSQLTDSQLPFFIPEPTMDGTIVDLPEEERAVYERLILGLDIDDHLMAYERERVASRGGITGAEVKKLEPGKKAVVVGNPIRLRFPPTQSGKRVVFFDLEDETGLLNVTCFDDVYQKDGHAIICSGYATVIGEAQDRDGHTAFLAHRVFTYQPTLASITSRVPMKTADFLVG